MEDAIQQLRQGATFEEIVCAIHAHLCVERHFPKFPVDWHVTGEEVNFKLTGGHSSLRVQIGIHALSRDPLQVVWDAMLGALRIISGAPKVRTRVRCPHCGQFYEPEIEDRVGLPDVLRPELWLTFKPWEGGEKG